MTNSIFLHKTTQRQKGRVQPRTDTNEQKIVNIELSRILPNRSQPRKSFDNEPLIRLADSIRQYGILQPLSVRRLEDGKYELIAGERRMRAAKLLGMLSVPCIIIGASERRSAELAIIENIMREDLNMFEQAAAIASLIEIYSLTQEQAAKRLSLSQSYVANKLRILRFTPEERDFILEQGLTERHARALLRLNSIEERSLAAKTIAKRRLNVAQAEEYIDKLMEKEIEPPQNQKIIIKDINLFYNSIDRAIDIIKRAGVDVTSSRSELDDRIEMSITIEK